jgi:hypothetical protein
MIKHLRKVLRMPYHKIHITHDDRYYTPMTKVKLRRLLKSQQWVDGIVEIHTTHKEDSTIILWRGKYA